MRADDPILANSPEEAITVMRRRAQKLERELIEAKVMLQIFDVAISTGVWPEPNSQCHKKIQKLHKTEARDRDS